MPEVHETHQLEVFSFLPEPYCMGCGFGPSNEKEMKAPCANPGEGQDNEPKR